MRTFTVGDIRIDFPEEISFCFNPEIVKISNSSNTSLIEVWNGERAIYINAEPFNGVAYVNISDVMQLFFDADNIFESSTGKKIDVFIRQNGEILYSFITFCMWGSIGVGERFNGSIDLVWYKNLPFTVSFYTSSGGEIWKNEDGKGYIGVNGNTPQMVYNIDPATLFSPSRYGTIWIKTSEPSVSVFDLSFDYTFLGIDPSDIFIKLIPEECTEGIYLRWIDKHGFIRYYLFKVSDITNTTSNKGEELQFDFHAAGRIFSGMSRQQSKEFVKSYKLHVPLVDKDKFDFLEGAYSSPIVDYYAGKDDSGNDVWCPVNVQVGSLVRTQKHLQDFTMVVNYPKSIMQNN
nr:MAG TPA: hypothetical protein [Caudoviricetes sp.]